MYDVADYLAMVADRRRVEAYLAAMRATIRPGDRVLELGTGFGYFAVHAARLGASHVWAVEPADAIALGPEVAALNGVADRITFVQGLGSSLSLDAPADVLVEDMRGVSPLHGGRLTALLDARSRLLRPGARVVPLSDTLVLTPAEAPLKPGHLAPGADESPHGIAIGPALRHARSAWGRIRPDAAAPLAASAAWGRVDYATFTSLDVEGGARWTVERAGTLGGFIASFTAELAAGIGFSTGPGNESSAYDCGWLPLASPVSVAAGDRVDCRVRAKFDGAEYVFVWDTLVEHATSGAPPDRRRDSTLLSRVRSPERLRRRDAAHQPLPGPEARLLSEALALADGRATLLEIAAELRRRHPGRFASDAEAMRWAGERLAAPDEEPAP